MAIKTRFNLLNALGIPQPPMGRLKRHGTIVIRIEPA